MVSTIGDAVALSLLDEGERKRLTLGATTSTPLITAFDQEGKIIWKAP
jgi:hypothetical protein